MHARTRTCACTHVHLRTHTIGYDCTWCQVHTNGPQVPHNVRVAFELEKTAVEGQLKPRLRLLLKKPRKMPLFRFDDALHEKGKSDYWGDDRHCRVYCSINEPCGNHTFR